MSRRTTGLAIEAEGLTRSFGDTRALAGIDLQVPAGTVYGLLGPNGAGKTTAVRVLATLLRPDGGSARVFGHDVVTEADAVRSRVSLTGQYASVDEDLTGTENLVLLARLLGLRKPAARERAAALLAAFGLTEASDRQVKKYSGGMRRRIDIAASILNTPDLLFLDEPTTGLDPRSRNQVWEIVRAVVAHGTTVLLTTQYLDEADQLAGRIAVVDHGRVIAEGTPGELKSSIGSGTVHLRLRDPGQRPEAERVLRAGARRAGAARRRPGGADRPRRRGRHRPRRQCPGRARARRPGPRRHRRRRLLPRPAEPGRGLPGPDRPPRRAGRRARRRAGGSPMSDTTTTTDRTGAVGLRPVRRGAGDGARARCPTAPTERAGASLTFGWRAMLKIKHVPEQLFDVTAFPIIMVLMFTYLFGGALAGSPRDYLQFFLPGIMVTSVVMITMYTGVGLNTDIEKGIFDRFRTLPVWRPAALVGMIFGDVLRYILAALVILGVGLVLGFRPDGGALGVAAGIGLLVVFSFAFSWVWTFFGLVLRSEKSVMGVSMMVLFPLTFLSNVFVEPSTMPGWLQAFVKVNPVTQLVAAIRAAMSRRLGRRRATMWLLLWSAGFVVVFGTLTMYRYNRR